MESEESIFWVYFYLPKGKCCKVYDDKEEEPRFPEFGFVPESMCDWDKKYEEPTSWRHHLITSLSEEGKYIEFEYTFYFYPDEDNEKCLEQLNDDTFWTDMFKEFYRYNLSLHKCLRQKILDDWDKFKEKTFIKDLEIKNNELLTNLANKL